MVEAQSYLEKLQMTWQRKQCPYDVTTVVFADKLETYMPIFQAWATFHNIGSQVSGRRHEASIAKVSTILHQGTHDCQSRK
jgi:hypothetical protein